MHRNLHVHIYSVQSYRSVQGDTLDPSPFKQKVRIGIGAGVKAIVSVMTKEQQAEASQHVTK